MLRLRAELAHWQKGKPMRNMLLSKRGPKGRPMCPYGCCTDWAPGRGHGPVMRRIARAYEKAVWTRRVQKGEE